MDTNQTFDQYATFCTPNYDPYPLVITEGEGVWVRDGEDNKYIDCLAGYSSLNQGHVHPDIYHALVKQAQKLTLTTRAFMNAPLGDFLEKMCTLTEMDMMLPMNTGVEAVESAIKAARKWGYTHKNIPDGKAEIITFKGNFHGRTTTIVSFSDDPVAHTHFTPHTPGFKNIPYGDIEALEGAITPHTCAILIEPIQGEAGVIIPPKGYLRAIRQLCDQHDILFICDEIQTGLGRTGKLFAYQHEQGAKPDLLLLGKALSGGFYPVSAVLGRRDVLNRLTSGTHGSTYGGNPLAAAVGIAAVDVILNEKLPDAAAQMGEIFLQELQNMESPHIETIRGRGLMMAIDVKPRSGPAKGFCQKLMALGVLCKDVHGQTIRISPPLIISEAEIQWLVKRFKCVFELEAAA